MRAGPLSNSKVIELLNRYFVPVTSSNQEIAPEGNASPAEKAERQRIYIDFLYRKLGAGDVHVYVVGPDKRSIAGLDISVAGDSGKMAAFLEQVATQLHTAPGPPVVKPHPQSAPPVADASSMVFHLVARGSRSGSWREFPSENWVVLTRPEWNTLLPPVNVTAKGASWEIPRETAVKLLEWFYPQTEETTLTNRNRIDQESLHLTVGALEQGVARARIDGSVRMRHSFYPGKNADDFAEATVIGFMDFDPAQRRIQRLRIVTKKAAYMGEDYDAALRSVSRETLDAMSQ